MSDPELLAYLFPNATAVTLDGKGTLTVEFASNDEQIKGLASVHLWIWKLQSQALTLRGKNGGDISCPVDVLRRAIKTDQRRRQQW